MPGQVGRAPAGPGRAFLGLLLAGLGLLATGPSLAQDVIYRCGNEYTNRPGDKPEARGCRRVEGGNLTVIQGFKPEDASAAAPRREGAAPAPRVNGARNPSEKVGSDQQRERDADARAILESELRKAEAKLDALRAEYRDGKPVRRPDEKDGSPAYAERVAGLKAELSRAESDVAGLKRELARLKPPEGAGAQ